MWRLVCVVFQREMVLYLKIPLLVPCKWLEHMRSFWLFTVNLKPASQPRRKLPKDFFKKKSGQSKLTNHPTVDTRSFKQYLDPIVLAILLALNYGWSLPWRAYMLKAKHSMWLYPSERMEKEGQRNSNKTCCLNRPAVCTVKWFWDNRVFFKKDPNKQDNPWHTLGMEHVQVFGFAVFKATQHIFYLLIILKVVLDS